MEISQFLVAFLSHDSDKAKTSGLAECAKAVNKLAKEVFVDQELAGNLCRLAGRWAMLEASSGLTGACFLDRGVSHSFAAS
jgi:hypothetical protein